MAATHLDIGLRCIQYLLGAVNALFVLTGVMIISIGTTISAVYNDFSHFLDPSYFSPASMLIVVGFLIFIIAFFGCCGAIKGSTCMVLTFAVLLCILLSLEVSAALVAYFLQDRVKGLLGEKINGTMHQYEHSQEAAAAIDFLQSGLRCCGAYGVSDWYTVNLQSESNPFPVSCCPLTTVANDRTICMDVYNVGCISRLSMIVHQSAVSLGTGAIAIALIQMTGIMFAFTLGKAIRRQKTERERRRWELRQSLVNDYQPLGKNDPLTTYPVIYMQADLEKSEIKS